jgi:DNA-binding XRE family transcriptional regulator
MRNKTGNIEFDGGKLVTLRRENNLSQAEVARRIGIRPQSLCGFEKNKYNPSAMTLTKLCVLFDARPQDFVRS